jgi:hypothetical protein
MVTKKVNLNEFKNFIKKIIKEDFNRDKIYYDIESLMRPSDNTLTSSEINDIANNNGVNIETVVEIMQSYLIDRNKERKSDLEYWVKDCLNKLDRTIANDWGDFYDEWLRGGYANDLEWASEEDVKAEYDRLTTDSNQLEMPLNENKKIILSKNS